ncbi:MAG: hypothetical protein II868_07355, partial [Butyrivibrio sp.]|nr:hypothetical protein [Butyrivibrio sp.]
MPLLATPGDRLEYHTLHFETYVGNNTIEHKLPDVPLKRGIWLVSISYHAEEDTLLELGDADSYTSYCIRGNSITLSRAETANTFRIYVDTGEISAIMRMYEQGLTSRFSVNQVSFYYQTAMSAVYYAVCTLFPFALLAAAFPLVRYLRKKCDREQQLLSFALFVLWVMISVPLMLDGIPHGHDTDAHILRVANLAEGLLQGMFPVRIQPGWYHDYGLPFGVCYPDLLLYLPAVLYLIGIPLWRAYQIYRLFINAVAALSAYSCFREITKNKTDGLLACVIYLSSVRFLVNNHV